jgi:hypothetical protein
MPAVMVTCYPRWLHHFARELFLQHDFPVILCIYTSDLALELALRFSKTCLTRTFKSPGSSPLALASSISFLALALAWLKRVLILRASLFFSLYLF